MPSDDTRLDERVLVVPVTRRDGDVTQGLLQGQGIACCICDSIPALIAEMERGAGALLFTEATLSRPDMPTLSSALDRQPAWSHLPVVVLIRNAGSSPAGNRMLELLDNVTVLDRPVSTRSMISAVQSALRDRRNQYRIRDQIEQQKRAEQALMLADRRKDEFLATLAHELRNPLAPIRTGLQILSKTPGADAQTRRLYEIMERQMVQMVKLIDELLEISRISTGKVVLHKERTDMRNVIRVALEGSQPMVDAAKHTLVVTLTEQPVWVYGDPARLAQVVSNLVNNAAKYTPDRGHIAVRMRHDDGQVKVIVEDNGVGIPEDMLHQVFDMFAQVNRTLDRAQGGLGIGLALVRRLMELHGGSVQAHSAGADRGSCFTLTMPALERVGADDARTEGAGDGAHAEKRLRVLVIDDNRDAAETLSMLLEAHGHDTHRAYNGRTGLDEASDFMPQAVFCDIEMPGMNGYEVAAALRRDPRHAPALLIAVTGRGAREDQRRSLDAGFDAHLTKPVGYDAVRQVLSRL
ncbi:ATP-binding protein [Piscinibacter gummiphilus]|uniref:histidine kinase n=1 Tax=Piscinibacter gummiphilus TaxID=946333 RepID=A0ABZ0CS18_9BURK|nr:ATP-binding protein [Piscinibacter gummiphilus]WOB07790.1 ATP-binding protein [Piscinibacter gummiphilus]